MDLKHIRESIKDNLEANLPQVLTDAGLSLIDTYDYDAPDDSKKKQLTVYHDTGGREGVVDTSSITIHVQLPGVFDVSLYAETIYNYAVDNITANLVNMEIRESIRYDIYPIDKNISTAFVFLSIRFVSPIDSCDMG